MATTTTTIGLNSILLARYLKWERGKTCHKPSQCSQTLGGTCSLFWLVGTCSSLSLSLPFFSNLILSLHLCISFACSFPPICQHLPLARFVCSDGRSACLSDHECMLLSSYIVSAAHFERTGSFSLTLKTITTKEEKEDAKLPRSCWTNTNEAGAKSCCCQYTHRLAFGEAHIRGREQTLSLRCWQHQCEKQTISFIFSSLLRAGTFQSENLPFSGNELSTL